MEYEKIMQWMELAKKYQTPDFWNGVFDQSHVAEFMDDEPLRTQSDKVSKGKFPAIDIYMSETDIIVIADLPGYQKEHLHVSVSGSRLLLKGSIDRFDTGQPVLQERRQGEFQRIVELPEPTDSNQIVARFNNGILLVKYRRQFFEEQPVDIT
ncbi:Hsp20/alpha crystallin family protein [Peribacillus sp. SCS-155]|uniref:Hsp20/alpha crystallin family protein n=1 Tax=Peribacillus sedimenti TaxID=3115297 RepID=UPI003906B74E